MTLYAAAVHMVVMGNAVTYSAITAAAAGAIVWASQFVHSHVLPAFEAVVSVLGHVQ
ncbi:hypothetical protein [Crystallibacter degradans]|uniref:hypothetical protein n=1 Tax=Crystallibacter degradans TaxID=2726743 RepID=UPI001474499B|nr:hypothetical protein [Arthrobacter sp. SF27]NMR31960.1 hypothetical protein [Arthrobacter sp. SF27]